MVPRGIASSYVLLICFILTGCGSIFIGFNSNQGVPSTITGTIVSSSVVLITDHAGRPLKVTRVLLTNGGLSNNVSFCGDQKARFPLDTVVKVEFTSGIDCMAIIDVVVL
jgi:hypothetical protein